MILVVLSVKIKLLSPLIQVAITNTTSTRNRIGDTRRVLESGLEFLILVLYAAPPVANRRFYESRHYWTGSRSVSSFGKEEMHP